MLTIFVAFVALMCSMRPRSYESPVLRWPGGYFAYEYHRMDGIGPRSQRPKM